ncbi:MAG: pyrroline-5-carboxylate reductase [Chlamydiota bacterium]|nr:pyrroline-5-carboxylate reductase [Chlamydiota bacterium]
MKIAVIGTGVMGSGLARVLAKNNEIILFNRTSDKAKALAKEINGQVATSLEDAIESADLILLTVKPKDLKNVSNHLKGKIGPDQVIVSALSATPRDVLVAHLGTNHVLRMMPNTPCFYGAGVVVLGESKSISKDQCVRFEELFSVLGKVHWVKESLFNAATALAGSGPAFIFVILESLVDAGVNMGLPLQKAKEMAIQVIFGAMTSVEQSGKHPGELKWEVTSPGGCTIAGLTCMEDEAVRSGLINTLLTTYDHLCSCQ